MKVAQTVALPLLGAVALLAAANAVYAVGQAEQVVVLRLGQPVGVVNAGVSPTAAGLHLKWPFAEQIVGLDRRTLSLQTQPTEIAGASPVTLRADMDYRIRNPLQFYRTLGDARVAERRLSQMLQHSLSRTLAFSASQALVNGRVGLDQVMLADLRRQAAADRLGVDVLNVHLADTAPSPARVDTVAQRMQDAETQQLAQIKAAGDQHKRELLAHADRDAADVRGEAERQALDIRGDGDAQRAAILGEAYGKDPAFARFFRRVESYDQALNPDNTTLVLSPDTAFLDLFAHGPGAEGKSPR